MTGIVPGGHNKLHSKKPYQIWLISDSEPESIYIYASHSYIMTYVGIYIVYFVYVVTCKLKFSPLSLAEFTVTRHASKGIQTETHDQNILVLDF